jgi:hypothetical protein
MVMSKADKALLKEREQKIRAQAKLHAQNRYMKNLERILTGSAVE